MEFKVEEKTKENLENNGFLVCEKKLASVDRRTTDDPSLVPAFYGYSDWWYEEGYNHRIEFGRITRDMEEEIISIADIESLQDLVYLSDKGFIVQIINDFEDLSFAHKEINYTLMVVKEFEY